MKCLLDIEVEQSKMQFESGVQRKGQGRHRFGNIFHIDETG